MSREGRRIVDLTQPIETPMPVSVGCPRVRLSRQLDRDHGDVATVEVLAMSLHTGTHVDAPMHFVEGGECVDEFPPWALCGPGVVVDAPEDGTWREITPEELEAWETASGERVGDGDVILLRTGHSQHWARLPEGASYMTNPWPYLGQAGAQWLVERGIRLLGVESPDPDCVDQHHLEQASFPTHCALLSAGIPIIENLARLKSISTTRFEFLALSLPITGEWFPCKSAGDPPRLDATNGLSNG